MPDDGERSATPLRPEAQPTATVVVPVHDRLEYTRQFVDHLVACTDLSSTEVVFVDNGSRDGTPEFLRTCRFATVLRCEENAGVAAAWNRGARAGHAPVVCFVNNDVVVTPGWLEALLAGLAASPATWCVGPLYTKGERPPRFDVLAASVASMPPETRVGGIVGFCFAVRRDAFERLRGFDEGFRIAGWEDTDFYVRLVDRGHPPRVVMNSLIHHYGGRTGDDMPSEAREVIMANQARFARKWGRDIPPAVEQQIALPEGVVMFRGPGYERERRGLLGRFRARRRRG